MRVLRTFLAVLAIVASSTLAGIAHAQVTNGSFEAGITGWTVFEGVAGACRFDSVTHPGNSTGAGAFPSQPPTQGTNVLVSDAVAISTCTLFQDVVVTSGTTRLSFAAGYNYADLGGDPTGAGCSALVGVSTTAGAPILGIGFSATGGTNIPMAARSVTFTAPVGSTVRIGIQTTSCAGGPAGVVADNFVLAPGEVLGVPTLSEWAMLLLALLLVAAAYPMLRGRAKV